jgi:hypothetical protein
MDWMDWFKAIAGRSAGQGEPTPRPRKVSGSAPSRRAGQGKDSYDKEWVRVLDDSAPERDPFNTYTWELDTGSGLPGRPAGTKPRCPPKDNPDDTYTWELQGDAASATDPWGLEEADRKKKDAQNGVNPYDTGIFKDGWGDRSKPR